MSNIFPSFNWQNLHFEWPWMIALLLVPLLVRLLFPPAERQNELPVIRFPHLEILRAAFGGFSPTQKAGSRLFAILALIFWFLLALALMRPQIVDQMSEAENQGYDIVLAVDLSGSMRALDFATKENMVNRLDVAKDVVSDFVLDRESERIGLVLFGDYAYQYAPLSQDTQAIAKMLKETVTSMAGDGTAIGDAIGLSVKALRNRPEGSRIIILLTDGEDTASSIPPPQAAKLAQDYGIKIYTIGIGSNGLVPYPDQYGQIVMAQMRIDEKLLQQIADTTGGKYYRATDPQALKKVYDEINRLEKSKSETRRYLIRTPLYRYPLSAALICLLLMALIPVFQNAARRISHA